MTMNRILAIACASTLPLLLSACGGSDDSCCDSTATPGGQYFGTLQPGASANLDGNYAIVDEGGYGRMVDFATNDYYQLQLGNDGLALSGTFAEFGQAAGFATQSGSFNGELTDQGLTASLSQGSTTDASLNMLFDFNYFNGSSLDTLAGTWSFDAPDGSFSINLGVSPNGSFSGSDSAGCRYAGNFAIYNADFDAYHVSYTLSCSGKSTSYAGLAAYYYADLLYPAGIQLLADDNAGDFLAVQVLASAAPATVAAAPASAARQRPAPRLTRRLI